MPDDFFHDESNDSRAEYEEFKLAEAEIDYQMERAAVDAYDPREEIRNKIREELKKSLAEFLYSKGGEALHKMQRIWPDLELLHKQGHFASVLVHGVTIYEIFYKEIVRSILGTVFFNDELADCLSNLLLDSGKKQKVRKEKELFPIFLRELGLDLESEKLPSGASFKEVFNDLETKRDLIVHDGKSASEKDSELMQLCIKKIMEYYALLIEQANQTMRATVKE